MLVGVREFLQMPEGTLGVLPCTKRLFRPDQLNHADVADFLQKRSDSTLVETGLGLKDGELVLLGSWLSFFLQENHFVNDVVERRPEVVNNRRRTGEY